MFDVNGLFFNHATSCDESSDVDIEALVATVDAFARISGSSIFVIDFDKHKMIYRSERLIYIDEVGVNDMQRECENPYWALLPEDALEKLLLIRNCYLLPENELSNEEYQTHVSTIDYPIRLRGHEMFVTQKFTPLVMRSDGITQVGMFTINSSKKKDVEATIITNTGRRFRFDFEYQHFLEHNLCITLTHAEKSILRRAKMGMTNEQIAADLYISINTVKTHRMRIFKKLHVETITEALSVISNYNIL